MLLQLLFACNPVFYFNKGKKLWRHISFSFTCFCYYRKANNDKKICQLLSFMIHSSYSGPIQIWWKLNALVTRQKGKSQNGCFKRTKHVKIVRKTNISYSLIRTRTFAYQGVRNVCFGGNFGVLCSLETPVFRFALLPYHRRMNTSKDVNCFPFQSLNMLPFYIRFKRLKLTYYSLLSNISEYSLKTATLPSFLIFSFICRFTIW